MFTVITTQKQHQSPSDLDEVDSNEAIAFNIILKEKLQDKEVADKLEKAALAGDEQAKKVIRPLQEALKKDGKYSGPIDGVLGVGTRNGMRDLITENLEPIMKLSKDDIELMASNYKKVSVNLKDSLLNAFENDALSKKEVKNIIGVLNDFTNMESDQYLKCLASEALNELSNLQMNMNFFHAQSTEDQEIKLSELSSYGTSLNKTKSFMIDL